MRKLGSPFLACLCLVAACRSKPVPREAPPEPSPSVATPSPTPSEKGPSEAPKVEGRTIPEGFTDPEKVRTRKILPPVPKEEIENKIRNLREECTNSNEPLDLRKIVGYVPVVQTYAMCKAASMDKQEMVDRLIGDKYGGVSEARARYEIWRDVTIPAIKDARADRNALRQRANKHCSRLFPSPNRRKDLDLCVERMGIHLAIILAKDPAECEAIRGEPEHTACRAFVTGNKHVCADLRDKERKQACYAGVGPLVALSRNSPDALPPLGKDTIGDELLAHLYFDDHACEKYLNSVVRPAYCDAEAGKGFGLVKPQPVSQE